MRVLMSNNYFSGKRRTCLFCVVSELLIPRNNYVDSSLLLVLYSLSNLNRVLILGNLVKPR